MFLTERGYDVELIPKSNKKGKIHQVKCLARIEKEFRLTKRIRRIKVITKTRNIIDFEK